MVGVQSTYPGGFQQGVAIQGVPVLNTYGGSIFWVDSGDGADATGNGTFNKPFATLDYAVGRCTANNGDQIHIKPGHTETVASAGALDLDVAGISIIGHGNGDLRPTINFTTATTADMDVDAADISMYNILFTGNVASLAAVIDVNADDFGLYGCEFRDVTGGAVIWVLANGVSRLKAYGLKVAGSVADGPDCVFQLTSTTDTEIIDFRVIGNFDTGFIESVTTANSNMLVHTGYFETAAGEDRFMTVQATDTGWVGGDGQRKILVRLNDNAANIDEIIVQSDGTTITSDMQFVTGGIGVVNADNERTIPWTGVSQSTDA